MKNRIALLSYVIVLFVIIAITVGCIEDNGQNNVEKKPSVLLNVIFDDYRANYTLEDIETFDSYTGNGGYIKTKVLPDSVIISDINEYTGVQITTLLEEIPNLPDNYNVSIESDDGRIVEYTINEILGNVDVYNETGIILSNETAVMIIAYKENGSYYSEVDHENEIGPLRIAFVGDNAITSSDLWSKMVVTVEIISI